MENSLGMVVVSDSLILTCPIHVPHVPTWHTLYTTPYQDVFVSWSSCKLNQIKELSSFGLKYIIISISLKLGEILILSNFHVILQGAHSADWAGKDIACSHLYLQALSVWALSTTEKMPYFWDI